MNRKFTQQEQKDQYLQLIRAIALGMSNRHIEEELNWTEHQVINRRKELYKKLNLCDTREITIYALEMKIVAWQEVKETIVWMGL